MTDEKLFSSSFNSGYSRLIKLKPTRYLSSGRLAAAANSFSRRYRLRRHRRGRRMIDFRLPLSLITLGLPARRGSRYHFEHSRQRQLSARNMA